MMKVQADILCTERRRSVQAVDSIRESPLSERAVKAAGSYPLSYGKRGRFSAAIWVATRSLFVPCTKGEKRLFILRKISVIKEIQKCLI